jgi:hypothetical protein
MAIVRHCRETARSRDREHRAEVSVRLEIISINGICVSAVIIQDVADLDHAAAVETVWRSDCVQQGASQAPLLQQWPTGVRARAPDR